ncbi:MAG: NAD(P)-dependent alcohol dehydrogenase [Haliscomenobacteraceae bacterium CHB4]|nr:NAD(P)-dependent alcohol dehydrogenase [Haliscomenobacteraceae bacterium CHB4]
MNTAVYTAYGPPEVLQVIKLPKPSPKDNEILVKIRATAVTSGDCRLRKADPFAVRFVFGLFKPGKPVLGGVLSGEIEAVGKNIQKFKAGDQVFGSSYPHFGAYAEYICMPETGKLAIKPENISHEEAAALPFGGMTALYFLRKANIQPGQKVLIYGASGAVGTAAVQIAKYFGAEVTGVCSTANMEMVQSLGADKVIDYTKTDFAKEGGQYDVVFETVNKAPFSSCVAALRENGTLILGSAVLSGMLRGLWTSMTSSKKVISGVVTETVEAVDFLQKMAKEGKLKAAIDKKFTLEQIAGAHEYVDKGHKKGNVVVCL